MFHSCREESLCYHACEEESAVLVINDALADNKYKNIPSVIGEPHVRFYAGAPLITPDGFKIGALCVIDQKPNQINTEQEKALQSLAKQVVSQMELRLHINLVNAHNKALERSNDEKNKFIGKRCT
jgi:GAF domain-containing protein